MKNKLMISGIIILIILNIFIANYAFNLNKKYEFLKTSFAAVNKNGLDTITLKINESAKIELGDKQYTLKVLEIIKDPPCVSTGFVSSDCVRKGEYDINFSINDVVFALDSGLNYSHPMISTDFYTPYIIYYVPEYNDQEATFFIKQEAFL